MERIDNFCSPKIVSIRLRINDRQLRRSPIKSGRGFEEEVEKRRGSSIGKDEAARLRAIFQRL